MRDTESHISSLPVSRRCMIAPRRRKKFSCPRTSMPSSRCDDNTRKPQISWIFSEAPALTGIHATRHPRRAWPAAARHFFRVQGILRLSVRTMLRRLRRAAQTCRERIPEGVDDASPTDDDRRPIAASGSPRPPAGRKKIWGSGDFFAQKRSPLRFFGPAGSPNDRRCGACDGGRGRAAGSHVRQNKAARAESAGAERGSWDKKRAGGKTTQGFFSSPSLRRRPPCCAR